MGLLGLFVKTPWRAGWSCALLTGMLCGGVPLAAQTGLQPGESKTVVIMPPTPLLPGKVAGLTAGTVLHGEAAEATAQVLAGPGCQPVGASAATPGMGGETCAAVLRENGLSRFSATDYARAAGGKLPAYAFEFGDATGAYSAYTFLRSQEHGARVTAGSALRGKPAETTTDADGVLVWAGTAVLRVAGHPSAAELAGLTLALPKVSGRKGLAPLLPTFAPDKELKPETVRYALGPAAYSAMNPVVPSALVDWNKSAETLWGEYTGRGSAGTHGTITLMLYPTPQIAGMEGRGLEKYFNEHNAASFGTLKLRRLGPLLAFSSGALGAEQAAALVGGISLHEDVTFDKQMQVQPQFNTEIHKTLTLLQSIALFVVLGLVAVLVIGGFLGGARAGWRVMHGKPAASEPEFLTINLRDEPKGFFAPKQEDRPE